MNRIQIEVCQRAGEWGPIQKYHAQVKDKPGVLAAGDSIDDAIGNLVRYHSELGIDVTILPGKVYR